MLRRAWCRSALPTLLLLTVAAGAAKQHVNVEYAVNCGGRSFVDVDTGVRYASDVDSDKKATPAGISAEIPMPIDLAPDSAQHVFQTERYAMSSFSYSVPTPSDGLYTMVLRFSEVYFRQPGAKVFDVYLGDQQLRIVKDLDIFAAVGWGTAHDVYVEFSISAGKTGKTLQVNGQVADIDDSFSVDFVKAKSDNPKVCAIVIVKGGKDVAVGLTPLLKEKPRVIDVEDDVEDDEEYDKEDEQGQPSDGDVEGVEAPKDAPEESSGGIPFLPLIFAGLAIFGVHSIRSSL